MEKENVYTNPNLMNLIGSFKKTGQSDDVIRQSLWQLGFIPELVESHLEIFNSKYPTTDNTKKIVKENKNMKLTLETLHINASKTISALEEMKSDNSLGFSASAAKSIIENCMSKLQITKDDEVVLQEKIKMGYKIDDNLVNPVLKYSVAENLFKSLVQYDWLKPVADFRNMISESFVGDKWSYIASNFAKSLTKYSDNEAFVNLYESVIDTLIDEENTRLALKNVLLENSWNREGKQILSMIVSEENNDPNAVYKNSGYIRKNNAEPKPQTFLSHISVLFIISLRIYLSIPT